MKEIHLGFKAYDIHELACHFVALHAGLYKKSGIRVKLLDTTFIPDDRLPAFTFQTACGAALISWLQGAPLSVVFVAADRPMFWLHGRPDVTSLEALRGRCIAGFPSPAPPTRFLALVLQESGIDSGVDLTVTPARDDLARLGLLQAGDAAAAVISSTILPDQVQRMGFRKICFFGDVLRVPTTGLAVHRGLLKSEPELVDAMVHCFRESLRIIHRERDILLEALKRYTSLGETDLQPACSLVRSCYTPKGICADQYLKSAIGLMKQATGTIGDLPTEAFYTFR